MTSSTRPPAHADHDLSFELARDRIAGLHASATQSAEADHDAGRSLLHRFRDAVGRRLIGLGTALAVDEGLRRRALRP